MKRILLLIMLLASFGANSQIKWNIVANVGTGSPKAKYKVDKTELNRIKSGYQFNGDLGARYDLNNLYFQATVGYNRYDNKFEVDRGTPPDPSIPKDFPNQVLQVLQLPIIVGYAYHNSSKFYPLMEVGVILNYTLDIQNGLSPIEENKFFPSFSGRVGAGYDLNNKLSLELKGVFAQTLDISKQDFLTYSYQVVGVQLTAVYKL